MDCFDRPTDCLAIAGGVPLHGTVAVSGSKNAALPILAASILVDGALTLARVPEVGDVRTLSLLLGHLGVAVKRRGDDTLLVETVDSLPTRADYELVSRMRASFCVLGPLLARRGRAVVSLPGGCNIGTRPVDLHLKGLAALGAEIRLEHGYVIAQAARLRGARINLRGAFGSTVTGTANVLSAATLAQGTTIIEGAAVEPEIVDLGRFLNACGARIEGLGTQTLEIQGVPRLHGAQYAIIPDRIEAATLLIAAVITRGTASVIDARPEHLQAVLETLTALGADVAVGRDKVTVHAANRPRAQRLRLQAFPGLPTDVQAPLVALLALAEGTSVVVDEVFPDRFSHVAELNRLGARIERQGSTATIHGVRRLSGGALRAPDLRAGAALVLAALGAQGYSRVWGTGHIARGYAQFDAKLRQLGADIRPAVESMPTAAQAVAV